LKIGYLGPEATFTDYAVRQLFPEAERIPFVSIPECMDAATAGEIDAAIVFDLILFCRRSTSLKNFIKRLRRS